MKKAFLLFVCIVLMFSLSSCATIEKDFELSQECENIQSIEIYNSERFYYERDIHWFRGENTPIALLSEEEYSAFLDSIAKIKFEKEIVFFPIPMDGGCDYQGYIVIIAYADGGYDVISEGGQYSYAIGKDGQGRHTYDYANYCGNEPWADFIEKYISK